MFFGFFRHDAITHLKKLQYSVNTTYMHRETKKLIWLLYCNIHFMQYSLYLGGLEPNPPLPPKYACLVLIKTHIVRGCPGWQNQRFLSRNHKSSWSLRQTYPRRSHLGRKGPNLKDSCARNCQWYQTSSVYLPVREQQPGFHFTLEEVSHEKLFSWRCGNILYTSRMDC